MQRLRKVTIRLTARSIVFVAGLMASTFSSTFGHADEIEPSAEPAQLLVTSDSGLISLQATDAPLGSVIDLLRSTADIDIEGHVDVNERVNANFANLPLEEAISAISDRYIIVHEESGGAITKVVLFRKGKDGLPANSAELTLSAYPRALDAWKKGDIRSAIDFFENAIDGDPDAWAPRADYARLLILMTDYEKAGPHFQRSVELKPANPRVWLDLYSYYQRTVQVKSALDARQRARELAGEQAIVQDQTGLWRLERDSIFPSS